MVESKDEERTFLESFMQGVLHCVMDASRQLREKIMSKKEFDNILTPMMKAYMVSYTKLINL